MALQASGTISINDLVAEFGGSAPQSLTDYYRGGGLVPDITANNSVPTSGAISLEDFYGASNADYTPDSINFNNLGPGDTLGNTVTVTGINQTITVRFAGSYTNGTATVYKNSISQGNVPSSGNLDVSCVNNDTLRIDYADTLQSGTPSIGGTINVTNESDGGALLDFINITTYGGGI
jgi:hypothetical protein